MSSGLCVFTHERFLLRLPDPILPAQRLSQSIASQSIFRLRCTPQRTFHSPLGVVLLETEQKIEQGELC